MEDHTLTRQEIMAIGAGRLMDTLIHEYVVGGFPERWLSGAQKMERAHWFEELPRACAEDDGGSCSADFLPRYSTDQKVTQGIVRELSGYGLRTEFHSSPTASPTAILPERTWYAGFLPETPDGGTRWTDEIWKRRRVEATTWELAVCRAALLTGGPHR